ncbi:alpha/beta fold hydrolase [Craterilacuibacter sinensis]|uniref:Alpha/beta fold hydrolase n=1 Tax=Craterilacuibacter sinensis TaxID=2686017 RepID=A0A845BKT7_9NEIS|nr:alpha/beta hydrolase [Craterilacuibacter sinensis]MXR36829.1 alpha/beta fold hydrolase [Craterilacuibacter sinensis]
MPYFEARQQRLFYEDHGNKDKPALLLLNGITMSTAAWGLLLPFLTPHFRVLQLDFCGQGLSAKPPAEHYCLSDQADDVATLLDQLQIGQANVAGLSYGGMVAQHFARRHAKRLSRLILAATLAWSDPVNELIARNWASSDEAGGFELRFDTGLPWLFSSHFLSTQKAMLPRLREIAASVDWPATQRLSRGVLEHDARAWLNGLNCETLVIVGSVDRLTPYYQSALLAQNIPHARLLQLDDCGHALHLEAPQALAHAITHFAG